MTKHKLKKASKPDNLLVECPNCKQPGFLDVWMRITSGSNYELKKRLMDGKLFNYTCPVCKTTTTMAYDCRYLDVERKICLIYTTDPKANEADARHLDKSLIAERLKNEKFNMDGYQIRVISHAFEFYEKVRIVEAGYDDRAIELMKVAIKRTMIQEGNMGPRDIFVYERTVPESGGISFIVFGEFPGECIGVPGGYDFCVRYLAEHEEEIGDEYRFDAAWANKFLA